MSGAVTSFDASNSDSAVTVGLERLIPPSFVGRASRSLSTFEHGGLPERAGLNFWWISRLLHEAPGQLSRYALLCANRATKEHKKRLCRGPGPQRGPKQFTGIGPRSVA